MKKSKILEKIRYCLISGTHLSFFRKFTSSRIHGYVLDCTDDFVLIHQTDNFTLDGYAILPLKTLRKVRCNAFDAIYHLIMQREGQLKRLGIRYPVELENWAAVFDSIAREKGFAIVECEQVWIDRFLIGKVVKAKKKKVELLHFEADGKYEEFVTEQRYTEISIVRFDERYVNVFSKYARKHNQVLEKGAV